jgi:F-type H+-transporting ATPase subunit delta
MSRVVSTYVKALFLAAQEAKIDQNGMIELESNLSRLSGAVNVSKELRSILKNPSVTSEEKIAVLKKIAVDGSTSKILELFLGMLSHKGRLNIISFLGEAFMEVRLESQGATLGLAESAEPLKEAELQELSSSFEKKLGKRVFFKTKIDPTLLAGVKVTVGGVTYDGTVRAQLNQIRDQMSAQA